MCILAFVFDLNFDITRKIIVENGYIEKILSRVNMKKPEAAEQLREAHDIIMRFLNEGSAGSAL